MLNDVLASESFKQIAGLKLQDFPLDSETWPQLELGLAALREALLDAILEFESTGEAEPGRQLIPPSAPSELAGIYD